MRSLILAMVVVAGTATAFPAMAQQQSDVNKALKAGEPNQQMQRDADKGAKTRNSGQSGYVADQDKPGAAAHPPGQPDNEQTTGSTSAPK